MIYQNIICQINRHKFNLEIETLFNPITIPHPPIYKEKFLLSLFKEFPYKKLRYALIFIISESSVSDSAALPSTI